MSVLARRASSSAAALARSIERRISLLSAPLPLVYQLDLPLDDDPERADAEPATELGTPGLPSPEIERQQLERTFDLATAASVAESKVDALRRLRRRIDEPAIIFTEYPTRSTIWPWRSM